MFSAGANTYRIPLRLIVAGSLFLSNLVPPLTSPARADVLGDVWGIATDPIKLGRASQNILNSVERIQQMLNQLGNVESTTNQDLTDRINQVKGVVDEVITAVNQNASNLQQIIDDAEQKIAALENQIYLDAESLLDRVQCIAQNLATIQIQQAIANAVAELREADPEITFLGITIINLHLRQIKITDPDRAYMSVRDGYLNRLNALGPDSSAYTIVSIYGNIERLAEGASCAYRDPTVALIFLKEEFNYRRLAAPWANIPMVMQSNP